MHIFAWHSFRIKYLVVVQSSRFCLRFNSIVIIVPRKWTCPATFCKWIWCCCHRYSDTWWIDPGFLLCLSKHRNNDVWFIQGWKQVGVNNVIRELTHGDIGIAGSHVGAHACALCHVPLKLKLFFVMTNSKSWPRDSLMGLICGLGLNLCRALWLWSVG